MPGLLCIDRAQGALLISIQAPLRFNGWHHHGGGKAHTNGDDCPRARAFFGKQKARSYLHSRTLGRWQDICLERSAQGEQCKKETRSPELLASFSFWAHEP